MPINPLIALQGQVPDVGKSFSNALLNIQRVDQIGRGREEAPVRQQLLEAQTATAEAGVPSQQAIKNQRDLERATSVVNAAVQINALPTNEAKLAFAKKRRSELIETASTSGRPANTIDTDSYISQLESGDFTGAQQSIEKTIASGGKLGILKLPTTKGGLASAKTEILESGATIQALPSGDTVVRNPLGAIVSGQERLDTLAASQKQTQTRLQKRADLTVSTARRVEQVKDATETANKSFGLVDKIRKNIENLKQVTPLIGQGANTGPIVSLFPSIKAETIKLENLQKRIGLDVVGATTFGALSKGELDLAKAVALPIALKGDDLIQWVNDSIAAKEKLANYYEEQSIFLSQGNTQADWLKFKRAELKDILGGATETDIRATMKANNMTRPQVIQELKRRRTSGGT